MLEDRLSGEREKRERFGRHTSSILEPIVEGEESEIDEGNDETNGSNNKVEPAVVVPDLPIPSPPIPSAPVVQNPPHSSVPRPSTRVINGPAPAMKDINHEGQLLKQSGFLGMWKHKYFVLDNAILKYYKREKDKLENNGSCKIFVLTSTTILAYAKLSLVFKVINEDAGEELCLMANSKDTLDQWIEALKSAISRLYNIQKRRQSTSMLRT